LLKIIKKFFSRKAKPCGKKGPLLPQKAISQNVSKIIQRLNAHGFQAYLVGGGVRDLLLGMKPKDFDIATNARPEELRRLFKNCRLIGRRFRLAHIYFHNEVIEVATFRAQSEDLSEAQQHSDQGILLRDNVYGSLEEDTWRRDFTINALYYDPLTDNLIDLTDGFTDLQHKQIRIIGEPVSRYREDPLRLLRAIRFAAKLDFQIETQTAQPFAASRELLQHVSSARLFDEIVKLFFTGHAVAAYHKLMHYDFFSLLFAQTARAQTQDPVFAQMLLEALRNTDSRIHGEQSINPAFLFAVFLWEPYQQKLKTSDDSAENPYQARQLVMDSVIRQQLQTMLIPKRLTTITKEIWELQEKLPQRYGRYPEETLERERFRAGYDFLLLRAKYDPSLQELADWWAGFQNAAHLDRQDMIAKFTKPKKRQRRKK
jgi:poly(A) polymerase